ncbi:telomere repeats-binding bouquet formation protein 1 [Hemitrygon akajei]|uniref:telomere repeats-binding bouquet formation protein 1 n=1 Tax=Hemitrygon akajei TaxID=2704970 RepID=UPI003BF9B749
MDNQEKTISNIPCGLKTDLDLLLECLKYQMDSPETQKQALVTIYSICQQNCEASDYFREIGGVDFIRGLIKLTNASVLREAALFTLGALAESSVYCQQSLCTLELLSDIAMSLVQKDASLILKRTDVYMILVLVSHNKIGQALARSTGCIDILLNLFRTRLPMSDKQSIHENIGQYYELWSSIGMSAYYQICLCIYNFICTDPCFTVVEENQRLCTTAFPFANECLQKCIRQEIIRPICAFIGLTVANNSYAQNYFCKVGGLDTLAQTVANLADECLTNHSNVELIISVIKTLDSCISENSSLASRLSKYSIVPMLVALLSQNNLDTNSKLGVILAIGHCTDGCEVHQYQLLKSNGLPLMIQIVAESQDEEQRKAATFVLQSCQLITEKLSNSLVENSQSKEGIITSNPKDISLRNYWKFAKEFLHRIETLLTNTTSNMDVYHTTTAPSALEHPSFWFCDSSLKGMKQTVKEDASMKHCREQQCLNEQCVDITKTNGWKRYETIQDFTPAQKKLDICQGVTGYIEGGSVIPTFKSSSFVEENKHQHQDQQLMEKVKRQIFVEDDVPREEIGESNNSLQSDNIKSDQINLDVKARNENSQKHNMSKETACSKGPQDISDTQNKDWFPETDEQLDKMSWAVTCRKAIDQPVAVPELRVQRTGTSMEEQNPRDKQECKQSQDQFKRPAPTKERKSKQKNTDPLTLCSDLIDNEISGSLNYSVHSLNVGQDFRCSGCSNVAASLNSRNFSKILQSCPNKCDRHKVIQECEDRYKKELKKLLNIDITKIDKKLFLTPVKRTTSRITDFHIQQTDSINLAKTSTKSFLLTPMKKSASDNITLPRQQSEDTTQFDGTIRQGHANNWKYQPEDRRSLCTPRVYNKTTFQNHIYSFDDGKHSDICEYAVGTRQTRKRRRRKDFTKEEVGYLLDGVLKMGYHWNSILWSYPFQKGRTNVDLAHKYRNLQKRNLNKSISGSQDCSVELC